MVTTSWALSEIHVTRPGDNIKVQYITNYVYIENSKLSSKEESDILRTYRYFYAAHITYDRFFIFDCILPPIFFQVQIP